MIRDSARIALRALLANRMRAVLTMLGLVIGVSSVIILLAVGQGAQGLINNQLKGLGGDIVRVAKAENTSSSSGTDSEVVEPTLDDVEALEAKGAEGGIRRVSPVLSPQVEVNWRGRNDSPSQVEGSTLDYVATNGFQTSHGRLWTETEEAERTRVAVIGTTVQKDLFAGEDPIGQRVSIDDKPFEVIGVLKVAGGLGPDDDNDIILMPYGAVESNLSGAGAPLGQIVVQATSQEDTTLAQETIEATLREQHEITDVAKSFQFTNGGEIRSVSGTIVSTLTYLLAGVGGISLFVGGIGVMNIMLVTVSERTREIGIRKAIGAQRSHIVGQFLLEALMLSGLGGAIGVLLGISVGLVSVSGFTPVVSANSVYIAFGVSVGIGLFFGIYPASRAANLRPIEALRYE